MKKWNRQKQKILTLASKLVNEELEFYNIRELSRLTGVSHGELSKISNNHYYYDYLPKTDTLAKLLGFFNYELEITVIDKKKKRVNKRS